jgi:hypothetical protein
MIPEEGRTGPPGIIIDWDMARRVGIADKGLQERTGTVWYMAVDLLNTLREPPVHNVLHDMESVFWVDFLYGLEQSRMKIGEMWLKKLHIIDDIDIVGDCKGRALQNKMFQIFQFLRAISGCMEAASWVCLAILLR